MKSSKISFEEKADLLKKISPIIAGDMSRVLQILSNENIKIEFSGIKNLDVDNLIVDIGEKCFGSHVNFSSPKDNIEGIAVAIFPLSGTNALIELLLKRYLKKNDIVTEDHNLKLSAFKEAVNILLLTYITGIANALKVELKIGVPKFDCFHNIEFLKPTMLRGNVNMENLVSVGQFIITPPPQLLAIQGLTPPTRKTHSSRVALSSFIKGRFIVVF